MVNRIKCDPYSNLIRNQKYFFIKIIQNNFYTRNPNSNKLYRNTKTVLPKLLKIKRYADPNSKAALYLF